MEGWPLWRRFLWLPIIVPYIILIIPAFLVFGVALTIWSPLAGAWHMRRLRGRMAAAGRSATWNDVERALSCGPGTIVWDSQTLGWPIMHAWWVPESLARAGGPPPLESPARSIPEDLTYYRWLSDRIVSPSTGTGLLLDGASTSRGCKRLQARCTRLRAAHSTLEEAHLWAATLHAPLAAPKRTL